MRSYSCIHTYPVQSRGGECTKKRKYREIENRLTNLKARLQNDEHQCSLLMPPHTFFILTKTLIGLMKQIYVYVN